MTDRPTPIPRARYGATPNTQENPAMTLFSFPYRSYTSAIDPGDLPEPTGSILIARVDALTERSESHGQALRRIEGNLHDLLAAVRALAARVDAEVRR